MHTDSGVFAQLRKLGLRPTSSRVCVLQVLQGPQQGPLAAERIFQQLAQIGISISLGTIYRSLHELVQHGLVQREWYAGDPAGKSRYLMVPAVRPPSAFTVVCRVCRRDIPVRDQQLGEALHRQAVAAGFDRMLASIAIDVVCNDCAAGVPPAAAAPAGS